MYGHQKPKQSHQCHYDGLLTFYIFYHFSVLRQYTIYKLWATRIIFDLDFFCGGGLIEHVGRFDLSVLYPQVAHSRNDFYIQSDEIFHDWMTRLPFWYPYLNCLCATFAVEVINMGMTEVWRHEVVAFFTQWAPRYNNPNCFYHAKCM